MLSDDTKNRLISVTKELLLTETNPEKITARQIAAKAEVNQAMINYCFASKDELLKLAIDEIISSEFKAFSADETDGDTPKEALKKLLFHISEVTLRYEKLTRLSVPYVLFTAPIEIPEGIMPYLREHFQGKKDESYLRIVAYEVVSFLQIVFYRTDDFRKYSGIDLRKTEELRAFINMHIDLLLGGNE